MGGASTTPDRRMVFAATQVRHCLDATKRLGGANYVLWGGREGYDTLLNTDLKTELKNFGRFLQLVVEHKHKIGFKGTILIEPKPHEPTKHQYDFDTATVYGFLKKNGLENEVKVNIEANHATLAGHSFDHEIAMADALGIFGSIDINRGDPQNGWDTDQFHNDPLDMTLAMYRILKAGGFTDVIFIGDSGGNQNGMRDVAAKLNEAWKGTGNRAHFIGDYYTKASADARKMLMDKGFTAADIGSHAGMLDTSEMMFVNPSHVRMNKRAPGGGGPSSGVSGDPTKATPELGKAILQIKIDNAVAQIKASMARPREDDQ